MKHSTVGLWLAALILAAKESGFDPAAIFADAYARTLPADAL